MKRTDFPFNFVALTIKINTKKTYCRSKSGESTLTYESCQTMINHQRRYQLIYSKVLQLDCILGGKISYSKK